MVKSSQISVLGCIFAIAAAFSLTGCSATGGIDDTVTEGSTPLTKSSDFSFTLKVTSDGKDISTRGDVDYTTLYVFNEKNEFVSQMTVDRNYALQNKTITLSVPGSEKITVAAWSGASSSDLTSMSNANIISDLQMSLKSDNGVVSTSGDLFYGKTVLYSTASKAGSQTLTIERKVSSVSLTTSGVLKVYDSLEGTYFYKVKKSKSSINAEGQMTGSDIEYIIPATLNSNGVLTAKTTSVLPSENVTIELYKDNKLILSSENVKNAQTLNAQAGKQLTVNFDLSRNYTSNVTVADWASVVQVVTVG